MAALANGGAISYYHRMSNNIRDMGICLRVVDFSETSQVVTLFTRENGLQPAIAKGSKRPKKSGAGISGPLDLLTIGEMMFIPKPTGDLAILTSWDVQNYRPALRHDLPGLNRALLCAEITLNILQPHDPHPELFDDLDATLDMLAGPQCRRAFLAYCLAALEHAGFSPAFSRCHVCGKPLLPDQPAQFFPHASTATCGQCDRPGERVRLPGNILLALSRLPRPSEMKNMEARAGNAQALNTAQVLLLDQIELATDRKLKTRSLVEWS